jgi:hypothetical protein
VFFYFKGKKKQKMKGTKLALTDFLADGSSSSPAGPVKTDWAAEMDNNDMEGACYFQFEIYNSRLQSVAITTNVVSSNPTQGKVYSIQHYVIKFVCDLRQVCGFL